MGKGKMVNPVVEKMPSTSTNSKKTPATDAVEKKKETSNAGRMTYATMIRNSIIEMKEKKGSSRQAILKYLINTYKVDANTLMVNKTIKKMVEDGKLVAGAQAGKSGSGSFKVSIEEKARIKQEEKVAAKKLLKKEKANAK